MGSHMFSFYQLKLFLCFYSTFLTSVCILLAFVGHLIGACMRRVVVIMRFLQHNEGLFCMWHVMAYDEIRSAKGTAFATSVIC